MSDNDPVLADLQDEPDLCDQPIRGEDGVRCGLDADHDEPCREEP